MQRRSIFIFGQSFRDAIIAAQRGELSPDQWHYLSSGDMHKVLGLDNPVVLVCANAHLPVKVFEQLATRNAIIFRLT